MALQPSNDCRRILRCLREAEALAETLADPRRLGQVAGSLQPISAIWACLTRPLPPPSAPWRSPWLAETSSASVSEPLPRRSLPGPGRLSSGDRVLEEQTAAFFDGAWRYERSGQVNLPAVLSRSLLAACHAELGIFAEGRALGGRRAVHCRGGSAPPGTGMIAAWGRFAVSPPRFSAEGVPPARAGRGHLSGSRPPAYYFPAMAAALGAAYAARAR